MKRKSSIGIGPGAASMILIFVILAMSVLGMLSLMNSRNDIRLSDRSLDVAAAVAALNEKGEETLAVICEADAKCRRENETSEAYQSALKAALPEGAQLEDDVVSWFEADDIRVLDCAVRLAPFGEEEKTQWIRHDLTAELEEGWN